MKGLAAVSGIAMALAVNCPAAQAQTYGDAVVADVARQRPVVGVVAIAVSDAQGRTHSFSSRPAADLSRGVTVPLRSGLGDTIGTVTVVSHRRGDALAISEALSHRIYATGVLDEAVPYVAGAMQSRRGQALIERAVDATPGLVTLALHVALPHAENRIVASNFGRIGKLADKDDTHVIADEATLKEVTNTGRRLAVELSLHDRVGRTIGALSTSFLLTPERSESQALAQAIALRDAFARRIVNLAWLAAS